MNEEEIQNLILNAFEGRTKSYCPYSGYAVGAAILTSSGEIYRGCNVENSSYGLSNCAERTAIFKAVSKGKKEFEAIAIVGGADEEPGDYAYPCGACRQVMREFCSPENFRILVARRVEDYKEYTLAQLLPDSFGPDSIV